jgi:hypothetical protein
MGEANDALHAELAAAPMPAGAAARAELDGMLAGLGGRVQRRGGRLGATLTDVTVARRLYRLLQSQGCEARLFLGRRAPAAGRRQAGTSVVRVHWRAPASARAGRTAAYARAFLRGATLAAGYLADPVHGYSLEWNLDDEAVRAGARRQLAAALARLGAPHGEAPGRRGGVRLYVKGGEAVGDLLLQLEAGDSMLRWENARALRAMRGRIHREVNGEAANLKRAALAGVRQAAVARRLLGHGAGDLPPALLEAARARVEHPEASLAELAALLGLSKSGLNQRMRRLLARALSPAWGAEGVRPPQDL